MSGALTPEEFQGQFNYIPAGYVFGKVSSDDKGFVNFMESNNIKLPLFDAYRNATGDRRGSDRRGDGPRGVGPDARSAQKIFDEGATGGAEMVPSIEEMSAGPDRDAHIAVQGGRTNDQIAEELRGQDGLLTQGQDAETAASLESGGQLDPSVAEALTDGQIGGQRSSDELDDAGAAEVSSAIQTMFNQSPFAQGIHEMATTDAGPEFTNPGSAQ